MVRATHAETRGGNQICIFILHTLYCWSHDDDDDDGDDGDGVVCYMQKPEPITSAASLTGESVAIRDSFVPMMLVIIIKMMMTMIVITIMII